MDQNQVDVTGVKSNYRFGGGARNFYPLNDEQGG